jgi:phosphoribosyl 1,2-cyclic phosphodiesterase/CheY-like chemotaxis protein
MRNIEDPLPMKTVLIIDDDATYRRLTGEILTQNGWQVALAEEGDRGIDMAKSQRPNIVLCDLLMPRCNGFQVCRALRAEDSLRQMKIVVTSGRDFASDRQAAFAAGADEYLTKPIRPDHLLNVLAGLAVAPRENEGEHAANVIGAEAGLRLKFWGVRGSIPTPGPGTVQYGGNTSCVEVRADGQIIILDAGTGLRLLGRELMTEFENQSLDLTLLLTHTHWDHIQGLPFFLPVYKPRNRLRILGYEGARHGLDNVLTSQMESPFFPIGLREVPANVRIEELKELKFQIGQVRVEACFANHPGICVGYRLFTSAGSVAFFPDNEPYQAPRRTRATAGDTEEIQYVRGQEGKMIEFLHGADVLIMDTQYDRDEYLEHVGWGHGCLDDVVALAIKAEAKQLFLFHHDPGHDDAKIEQMVAHARRIVANKHSSLHIDAAREGATFELSSPANNGGTSKAS